MPDALWGFNPRTPCGVRPTATCTAARSLRFQSTHSLRSATETVKSNNTVLAVSIHALLAECDRLGKLFHSRIGGFNPRTPCGVRLIGYCDCYPPNGFQSTHSLRSATKTANAITLNKSVSIHALLAECDFLFCHEPLQAILFQSTHSLRSATCEDKQGKRKGPVSIHALLAECDDKTYNVREIFTLFQSTHSLRSATIVCICFRP